MTPAPPAPAKKSLTTAGVLIALVAALLGAVVFVVLHKTPKPDAPVAIVDPNLAKPGPDTVELNVTSNAPGAQLFLDDAPLGPSPYHGVYPRDGVTHRIRAEAPVYAPRTEVVVFDKPAATIDLTLLKGAVVGVGTPGFPNLGPKNPPTGVVPPPHTAAPPNTAVTMPTGAATGHKPPRTIDTSFGP
jgi:hypothetical protein